MTVQLCAATEEAEVAPLGAQVLSYRVHGSEVLWRTPTPLVGRPLRGGVPICFPWFGARAGAPAHGFARTVEWTPEEIHADRVVLLLRDDEATRVLWPHPFRARLTVAVGGGLLTALEVANPGDAPIQVEVALHGYLAVDDVRRVRIRGLPGGFFDKTTGREATGADPWVLARETDAVFGGTEAPVEVEDDRRVLRLEKGGSRTTVVWNPWEDGAVRLPDVGPSWTGFVCVEAAAVGADRIVLAPGAVHVLRQVLRVSRSG